MKPPSEPTRFLDPSSGAPAGLRRLLAEGHEATSPTDVQLHRLAGHMGPLMGGPSGSGGGNQGGAPTTTPPGAPPTPPTGALARTLSKSAAVKLAAVVLVGGAVVGGVEWQRHTNHVAPSLHSEPPGPVALTSVPGSTAVEPSPLSLSPSASAPQLAVAPPGPLPPVQAPVAPTGAALASSLSSSTHAPKPLEARAPFHVAPETTSSAREAVASAAGPIVGRISESPPSLGAGSAVAAPPAERPKTELELLAEARKLERDPARALDVLAQHRRRFQNGTFEEEREVLVVESLVRLHRTDEAVARAASLARRFPNSVHLRRIRVVLGQNPSQ